MNVMAFDFQWLYLHAEIGFSLIPILLLCPIFLLSYLYEIKINIQQMLGVFLIARWWLVHLFTMHRANHNQAKDCCKLQ